MGTLDERYSEQFRRWEVRTRGWRVYPYPVSPEPVFEPFHGHGLPETPPFDDGRRPSVGGSFLRTLFGAHPLNQERPAPPPEYTEPEPPAIARSEIIELPLFLSSAFTAKGESFEHWIGSLSVCTEPIAFEVIGTHAHVSAQLAIGSPDEAQVRQQLRAFFPDIVTTPATTRLSSAWNACDGGETAVVEFGLELESVLPLTRVNHDLCVPLVGVLSELAREECALLQVIFQHVQSPWADSLERAVCDYSGKSFFVNAPELAGSAKNKISRPLFGVVVRLAARSPDYDRAWGLVRNLASALSAFANLSGNSLIPLRNDEYPYEEHGNDVLARQCRRSGMILNADELFGFIRFPTSAVRSSKFLRQTLKSNPAPAIAVNADGLFLGLNEHGGEVRAVRLTPEQRVRHMHLVGSSGTGKTTLLFNLIRQDIESGQGVAVLDPHGDLIEKLLGIIPDERLPDVVLLDPSDEEHIVGFNILSAHADWEKNLLASDLVSVFRRLSTSWGDQMGSVLQNAILAFLESSEGGSLADMRRFFLEPAYRERFLKTVRDPDIVYYWHKGFAQLSGNKSIGPIITRLETFLAPKPIRYMVGQSQNRLDFGNMLDSGKIFLAKLSQGQIGKENSYLLGSLLVAKFHQTAMSRQRQEEKSRRDFWIYLDEFQDFITPSMAEILTGARKYRIGLTLAHQELRQLERERDVAGAVLANAHTRIVFRVGDHDARALESGFANFEARDLQNLGTGEAICRVERSGFDFNLAVTPTDYPEPKEADERREAARAVSRSLYATPREEVEARFMAQAAQMAEEEKRTTAKTEAAQRTLKKRPTKERTHEAPPSSQAVAAAPEPSAPDREPELPPVNKEPPKPSVTKLVESSKQESKPISDPGRGGAQHKAIQQRLKKAAEELGYQAVIEQSVLGNKGSVDLALRKGSRLIACEISLTTTIDHEVGNVTKCLKAGFADVAVVCPERARLAQIETAIKGCLDAAEAGRVRYYLPEELIADLRTYKETPPPLQEKRVRGYKIKREAPNLTPEEADAKEEAAIKIIAEAMRKKL